MAVAAGLDTYAGRRRLRQVRRHDAGRASEEGERGCHHAAVANGHQVIHSTLGILQQDVHRVRAMGCRCEVRVVLAGDRGTQRTSCGLTVGSCVEMRRHVVRGSAERTGAAALTLRFARATWTSLVSDGSATARPLLSVASGFATANWLRDEDPRYCARSGGSGCRDLVVHEDGSGPARQRVRGADAIPGSVPDLGHRRRVRRHHPGLLRGRVSSRAMVAGAHAGGAGGPDRRPRGLDPRPHGVPARGDHGHGGRPLRYPPLDWWSRKPTPSARPTSRRTTCPTRPRIRSRSCCGSTCRCASPTPLTDPWSRRTS